MPPTGTVEQLLDVMHARPRADINRLIAFTGAHPTTVGGWLLGNAKPPIGEMLFRVAYFFDISGWKVAELERPDPLAARMARYWMAGAVTVAEIKSALHYTAESNSDLLEFIYGKRRPLSVDNLRQLLDDKHTAYEDMHADHKARFGMSDDPDAPAPAKESLSPQLLPKHKEIVIQQLAALLREAKPLAERINSDDYSDGQRDQLRNLVGKFEYFELSTTLNQLTGPRQRKA